MGLGIRAGGERAASITVVLVELDEGPRAQMDMDRGIRALRVAVALELVVARHPGQALSGSLYSCGQMRPGSGRLVSSWTMATLPEGPTPRRYAQAVRSCLCHRCGRPLVGRTRKLLRTMYRAHLRTCPRAPLA
jgi:hypothetical protein